MKNISIAIMSIFVSFNALSNDFEPINYESINKTSAIEKIYLKNQKMDYIDLFNDNIKNFEELKKESKKSIVDICTDIYNGENGYKKNPLEGSGCLQLEYIRANEKAALSLSNIYKKNKYFYLGMYAGFGGIPDFKLIVKKDDINSFVKGLNYSRNTQFLKQPYKKEIEGVNFIDFKIYDEEYFLGKNEKTKVIKKTYELMKDKKFEDLINYRNSIEYNAKNIIVFSKYRSGELSLVKDICESLENYKMKMYCLKSKYKEDSDTYAFGEYMMSLIRDNNNNQNLKEISFMIGINKDSFVSKLTMKKILEQNKDDIKTLSLISEYYNKGRYYLIVKNT